MLQLTLGQRVLENAVRYPDRPAYLDGDRILSHQQLRDRGVRLASALAQEGVRRQDRIALMGRNSLEYGEVLAAGQLSGIVVGTVNFRLAPAEVATLLDDISPTMVIADAEYVPMLRSLPACPARVVGIGDDYEQFLQTGAPSLRFASSPEDLAYLIYTSGTTGRPKGCMLGQWEMRQLARDMNDEMRIGCDERALLVMPLLHIGAMSVQLGVHARGGACVLLQQFDPAAYLEAVERYDVNLLHLAPPLLQQVLDAAGDAALQRVRTVVYSAAPMTQRTLRQALTTMPGSRFLNLYGQTEVISTSLPPEFHSTSPDTRSRNRLASVGMPFIDTELRIVDENLHDCPIGTPGEILVRKPAMFRGYWNHGAATAGALRDGWCHSGDAGYLDDEGLVHLVDRMKDVINSGGEKIYSREVEEAVASHPSVVECAVIGVPDERWGETVCAVVVAAPDRMPELETLAEHARATIARYKVPRRLLVVDAMPLLLTGKIDKKALRQRYQDPAGRASGSGDATGGT